ncbi:phage DNA packaging protein J [Streptomyces sp. NPDC002215]
MAGRPCPVRRNKTADRGARAWDVRGQ